VLISRAPAAGIKKRVVLYISSLRRHWALSKTKRFKDVRSLVFVVCPLLRRVVERKLMRGSALPSPPHSPSAPHSLIRHYWSRDLFADEGREPRNGCAPCFVSISNFTAERLLPSRDALNRDFRDPRAQVARPTDTTYTPFLWGAFDSAKNRKRQRRKRQSTYHFLG